MYHAKVRAQQRYNLNLTPALHKTLVNKIQNNQGTYVCRRSNRTSVWRLTHLGKHYHVVYDTHRHTIVTFLPNDWHVRGRKKPKQSDWPAHWNGYYVDFNKKNNPK